MWTQIVAVLCIKLCCLLIYQDYTLHTHNYRLCYNL